MLAFIKHEADSYCVLQQLRYKTNGNGRIICNEYDCPLLTVDNDFLMVKSNNIVTDISVIHHCTDECVFAEATQETIIERQSVDSSKLTLQHDYSNNTHFLNIYALSFN